MFEEIKTDAQIPTYKYLISGSWQESRNRRLINLFSPIDNSLIGRIQSVLPKEADIAVTDASCSQPNWAACSVAKRIAILQKAVLLIQKNKPYLSKLLTEEIGKLRKDSESEVDHAIAVINESIKEKWQENSILKVNQEIGRVTRVPLGVVLCITPFNYPIYTTATKVIPALLSGNSVILKPSIFGSISVLHFAYLLQKAGLPAGVFNVITGYGDEIGDYLAQHELVNMISFTGSSKVGKRLAEKAKMVHLVFELGGKDAAIVLKNADLDRAANEIVHGAFAFAGQRCMAVKRVIVDKAVKNDLVEKMKQVILKDFAVVGDPRDKKTQLGPVISDKQADYLETLLQDALKKGATLIVGGKRYAAFSQKLRWRKRILEISKKLIRLKRGHGNYIQATLLDNVTPSMRIAWEEQFGPILPVLTVDNEEEAIKLANASEYGLDASIFTKDVSKARKLAEKLEVGQVFINVKPHRSPDQFPFTGVKSSGLGTQGVKYSIQSMTRFKVIREQNTTSK